MTRAEQMTLPWRKSSRSSENGSCVEAAMSALDQIHTRDSKVPTGPTLTLSPSEWAGLLTSIRTGELDC